MFKLIYRFLFLLVILTTFLNSCKSEEKSNEDQALPFEILNEDDFQVSYGKEIEIKFQINQNITKLIAIKGIDTLKRWNNVSSNFNYSFSSSLFGIGKYDIQFLASLESGNDYDQTITVDVLSDQPFNMMEAVVISSFPHASNSFTQGLEFDDESLYEGTGDPGYSGATFVAKTDLKTGNAVVKESIPTPNFGEGITLLNGKLYQLTWQQHTCFIYDKNTLKKIGEFKYEGEGWGLCNDGTHLIMSNGTSTIVFRDPRTFKIVKTIQVATNKSSVSNLNELEFANGLIYANVWQEDVLVSIDPENGKVKDLINCYGIVNQVRSSSIQQSPSPEVLNGIAFNSRSKTFFLTGKYWPTLFEVNFITKKM